MQNNRKVNAGKKNFIDKGRLALTNNDSPQGEKDRGRRGRTESSSTLARYDDEGEDEDDVFSRLIDNNNNVDEYEEESSSQYQIATGHHVEPSTSHANLSKRQIDSEDSSQSPFEPPSSKKAKIKPLPRKMPTKQKPNRLSRSIYQTINGRMIDITGPQHAEEVNEVCKEGTPFGRHIQGILDRHITRRKAAAAVPPGAYRISDEAEGDDENSVLQDDSQESQPYSTGRRRRY